MSQGFILEHLRCIHQFGLAGLPVNRPAWETAKPSNRPSKISQQVRKLLKNSKPPETGLRCFYHNQLSEYWLWQHLVQFPWFRFTDKA